MYAVAGGNSNTLVYVPWASAPTRCIPKPRVTRATLDGAQCARWLCCAQSDGGSGEAGREARVSGLRRGECWLAALGPKCDEIHKILPSLVRLGSSRLLLLQAAAALVAAA